MAQDVFSIDGKFFDVLVPEGGIERSFAVTDTDKAGRAKSGGMIRDIIGTYYNYKISIPSNKLSKDEYDELYDIISAPVNSHKIRVPYGQRTLEFDAYITGGTDKLFHSQNGNVWKGLQIEFIAMKPQRR